MALGGSSSSGRLSILLMANLLLFPLGLAMLVLGCVCIVDSLMPHLDFASSLFAAAPALLVASGVVTMVAAAMGVLAWMRHHEMSRWLRVLGALLAAAACLSLAACITCFVLREVIARQLINTRVADIIRRYDREPDVRSSWDKIQTTYKVSRKSVL